MTLINLRKRSTSGIDEDALVTTLAGEQVFNFGRLTTTGDFADGIFADADGVSIANFARIETSGVNAIGILVHGDDAHIANTASIVTRGGRTGANTVSSDGIRVEGHRFDIVNLGTIRTEGGSAVAMAGVGTDGVIVNFGRVETLLSTAMSASGAGSQAINRGHVTVHDGYGTDVTGTGAAASNSGTIRVMDGGDGGMRGVLGSTELTNTGVIRVTANSAYGMITLGSGHQLSNYGTIQVDGDRGSGMTAGRIFTGDFATGLEFLNAGRIVTHGETTVGISVYSQSRANGIVVNQGVVDTDGNGGAGVLLVGDGHRLTNSGRITTDGGIFVDHRPGPLSAAGVIVSGDDVLVENERSGVIRSKNAGSPAVELNVVDQLGSALPVADRSSQVENSGLIQGASIAILGGAGQETVINRGRIVGDVDLGNGADTFVFQAGGTVNGQVRLGGGADLVRVENGSGRSVVADFAAGFAGGDLIDLSEFFTSFAEVQSHSRQRGIDVVITLDHDDKLVLQNVQLSALNAGDFLLV